MNKNNLTRRDFLIKSASLMTVVYIIPDLVSKTEAKPLDEKVSSKTKWAMNIDVDKCTKGCTACVEACIEENGLYGMDRPETDSQWIRKLTLKDIKTEKIVELPMLCQHCENPPCCDVCPTGASFRREDGIVMVNQHTCIGCRYCMMACPFKARSFVHENLTEPVMVLIKDRVAMAIEKYEPRVSVEDVVVREDETNNGLDIMVSFLINGVEEPISVSTFLQRVR